MADNVIKLDLPAEAELDMTPEEYKEFVSQPPTRAEVMSYVNGLLEDKYMPSIIGRFNQQTLLINSISTILVNRNIVTPEEMAEVVKQVEADLTEQLERAQSEE